MGKLEMGCFGVVGVIVAGCAVSCYLGEYMIEAIVLGLFAAVFLGVAVYWWARFFTARQWMLRTFNRADCLEIKGESGVFKKVAYKYEGRISWQINLSDCVRLREHFEGKSNEQLKKCLAFVVDEQLRGFFTRFSVMPVGVIPIESLSCCERTIEYLLQSDPDRFYSNYRTCLLKGVKFCFFYVKKVVVVERKPVEVRGFTWKARPVLFC